MSVATKRFVVGGLAAGLVALAVVPAIAETQPFTGPGVVAGCAGPLVGTGNPTVDQAETVPAEGVGAWCFQQPSTGGPFVTVTTSVVDGSNNAVPYEVQFQDASGNNSATIDDVCPGDSGTVALPSDIVTEYTYLFVDDPATAKINCGANSVATTGTMSLTWNPATP